MNHKFIILLLLAICANGMFSQTTRTFINPGVKVGYAFGNVGGLIMGLECSFSTTIFDKHTRSYGIVIGIEGNKNITKYHIGGEYFYDGLGLEWGPSYLRKEGKYDVTTTATLYTWVGVIPYASMTFNNEFGLFSEYGLFIKLPRQLSGPDFRQ